MEGKRIRRFTRELHDGMVKAAYNTIEQLSGKWKLSKDLHRLTDKDEKEWYNMLYYSFDDEIVAFPDFMTGEHVQLHGSKGNTYTLNYETPEPE